MAEIDDTTERIADASAMEDAVELSGEGLELLIRIADELQVEQDVEMGGGSPEPTAEPSAEPAMAPSPDEVRREKNRLKVRRHYHRRLVRYLSWSCSIASFPQLTASSSA